MATDHVLMLRMRSGRWRWSWRRSLSGRRSHFFIESGSFEVMDFPLVPLLIAAVLEPLVAYVALKLRLHPALVSQMTKNGMFFRIDPTAPVAWIQRPISILSISRKILAWSLARNNGLSCYSTKMAADFGHAVGCGVWILVFYQTVVGRVCLMSSSLAAVIQVWTVVSSVSLKQKRIQWAAGISCH